MCSVRYRIDTTTDGLHTALVAPCISTRYYVGVCGAHVRVYLSNKLKSVCVCVRETVCVGVCVIMLGHSTEQS